MRKLLIPIIAITLLTGCTQLSDEDRALIRSATTSAEDAEAASIRAADEAKKAREDADKAAASADAASKKADKIFRQGQNK